MRHALLPFAGWLAALQSVAPVSVTLDTFVRLISVAGVLGTLTVLVYRLGVWRQEMENTKNHVGVRVHASLTRIEQRLDAIDHTANMIAERQVAATRQQARTDRRLDRLEETVNQE